MTRLQWRRTQDFIYYFQLLLLYNMCFNVSIPKVLMMYVNFYIFHIWHINIICSLANSFKNSIRYRTEFFRNKRRSCLSNIWILPSQVWEVFNDFEMNRAAEQFGRRMTFLGYGNKTDQTKTHTKNCFNDLWLFPVVLYREMEYIN